MKKNFLNKMTVLILVALGLSSAGAQTLPLPQGDLKINGAWKLSGILADGQKLPAPNPELDLLFEFSKENVARLFWSLKNERGFCDRKASYRVIGNLLYQKIFWTHPENLPTCVKDPDMQIDHESVNHVDLKDGKLLMDVPLADKTVTYIFDSLTKPTTGSLP